MLWSAVAKRATLASALHKNAFASSSDSLVVTAYPLRLTSTRRTTHLDNPCAMDHGRVGGQSELLSQFRTYVFGSPLAQPPGHQYNRDPKLENALIHLHSLSAAVLTNCIQPRRGFHRAQSRNRL